MWHWKSALVAKPARESKCEVPTRTIADKDYFAFRTPDFVFSQNVCVNSSCVLNYSWEWGVLE